MDTYEGFVPVVASSPPRTPFWGLDIRISSIISIQSFKDVKEYKQNSIPYAKRDQEYTFFENTLYDFNNQEIYEIGLDKKVHGFEYFIVHPIFNKKMQLIAVGANKHMHQFLGILKSAPKLIEYAKRSMDSAEKDYEKEEKRKRMKSTRE